MLGAIGRTPVIRLERLAGPDVAEVWVKLENANPTGSYKDRMALAMIEGAERSGRLKPGQTVVEYTGGSTGSSLAFVCAVKGYKLRIVTSDAFAAEKLRTMRAFGAELEVIPSPEGITGDLIPSMMRRAAEIVDEVDGFATDQFNNRDMVEGYAELGRELLDQLGRAHRRVLLLRRHGRLLPRRHRRPAQRDPGRLPGDRRAGRVAGHLGRRARHAPNRGRRRRLLAAAPDAGRLRGGDPGLDGRRHGDGQAGRGRRGLLCGPSTGANITVALELAGRLGPGKRVVTTNVDSGLKYLAGHLYAG